MNQIAGLGVIVAHSMDWEQDGLEVQVFAVSAALIAAIGLNLASVYLIAAAESPSTDPLLPCISTSI